MRERGEGEREKRKKERGWERRGEEGKRGRGGEMRGERDYIIRQGIKYWHM